MQEYVDQNKTKNDEDNAQWSFLYGLYKNNVFNVRLFEDYPMYMNLQCKSHNIDLFKMYNIYIIHIYAITTGNSPAFNTDIFFCNSENISDLQFSPTDMKLEGIL
jgi:hypothetical protein